MELDLSSKISFINISFYSSYSLSKLLVNSLFDDKLIYELKYDSLSSSLIIDSF